MIIASLVNVKVSFTNQSSATTCSPTGTPYYPYIYIYICSILSVVCLSLFELHTTGTITMTMLWVLLYRNQSSNSLRCSNNSAQSFECSSIFVCRLDKGACSPFFIKNKQSQIARQKENGGKIGHNYQICEEMKWRAMRRQTFASKKM